MSARLFSLTALAGSADQQTATRVAQEQLLGKHNDVSHVDSMRDQALAQFAVQCSLVIPHKWLCPRKGRCFSLSLFLVHLV